MTATDRIDYDEFGLFHENAAEFGLPYDGPPTVARTSVEVGEGRNLSALVWGEGPPEIVLIHGGAQNAHTWDTVAMALGRSLVAVDLPGHGHSDGPRNGRNWPEDLAADVAVAIRALAPEAAGVVGMSLGGMTTIELTHQAPDLLRHVVLVDITPGVTADKARAITNFIDGPASFANFDELLARTIEHNPGRSRSSLRRGILHNAVQLDDGSWVWRHARGPRGERPDPSSYERLWGYVSEIAVPLLLVRGMRPQSVVDDGDEAELLRRQPSAKVVHVQEAGHSVQGDTPVELAALLDDFIPRPAG